MYKKLYRTIPKNFRTINYMARKTIPKKIKNEIAHFVNVLKADNLPINRVILYGSYATGKQHKWSDIDLCVISPRFKNPWLAMQYLWSKRPRDDKYTIEPIGYSPKDFSDADWLINEIKRTGIKIKV